MMTVSDVVGAALSLGQDRRPYRLHFPGRQGEPFQDLLAPQRLDITESICDGVCAHVTCLAPRADIPLKELLGLPVEVRIVTDTGSFKRICVVITEARQGQSDGSLTVVQFTGRDILAAMQGRRSNRAFKNMRVPDILRSVLDDWRKNSASLAHAFDYAWLGIDESRYPERAATLQVDQSDSDFLRALCARHGIAWFFRAAPDGAPTQQLVFFDDARQLPENTASPLKYHRRSATEPRDTVSFLTPGYALVKGAVSRASHDHETARTDIARESGTVDQGHAGNAFASALHDARIEAPHAADSWDDHQRLTRLDIEREAFRAECLHGIGGVRAQAVGEYDRIDGHPMLDTRPEADREYVTVQLQHWADNSLPKELDQRAQVLLAASSSGVPDWVAVSAPTSRNAADPRGEHRYTNRFLAVPRTAPIVPTWNPATGPQRTPHMTGTVIGFEGRPVHCDALGRVKVRIHGFEPTAEEGDTAWVRSNSPWAGEGFGMLFPLRDGMEVSLAFEQGDPSRPMIVGARYGHATPPARFDHLGSLPANAALSGIVTRELNGARQQQLRFNDTHGRISTQLGSEHTAAQLNLGDLSTPMNEGRTEPRGEGAELRTDAALAARGARGVLITAEPARGEGSPMLERASVVGLIEVLHDIQQQLAQLASTHRLGRLDGDKLAAFIEHLKNWENGSSTSPQGADGGAPMVVVAAPSTVALAAGDSLTLGAQTDIDMLSVGDTKLSAGRGILLHSGRGLQVFAQERGVKVVAAQNDIDIQAHQGDLLLSAAKGLRLRAGEEISLEAPVVRQVATGVQVDLGSGQITQRSAGAHVIKSSSFAQLGPGGGSPAELNLPASVLSTDERYVVRLRGSGLPAAHRRYEIGLADGGRLSGRTDAQGRTRLASAKAMDLVSITLFDD